MSEEENRLVSTVNLTALYRRKFIGVQFTYIFGLKKHFWFNLTGFEHEKGALPEGVEHDDKIISIDSVDDSHEGEYICSATNEFGHGRAEPVKLVIVEGKRDNHHLLLFPIIINICHMYKVHFRKAASNCKSGTKNVGRKTRRQAWI